MTIHTHDDAYEPAHSASQTAHALDELQLYGYRPFDEPDPRPMPDGQRLAVAVADIFDALVATLEDTRMEPDLEEVLWGQVNLFTAPRRGLSGRSTRTSRHSAAFSGSRTAPR